MQISKQSLIFQKQQMAKDLESKPVTVLFQYLTILENTNSLIESHWETIKAMVKKNEIPESYANEQSSILFNKTENNNKIIDKIEKVIFKKMKSDLGPDIVFPSYLITAEEKLKQEFLKYEKLLKKEDKKKSTPVVNMQKPKLDK